MTEIQDARAFLGKRVNVGIGYQVAIAGKLLSFGDGGDLVILGDDGFMHYAWPMLEIREVPADETCTCGHPAAVHYHGTGPCEICAIEYREGNRRQYCDMKETEVPA